MARYNLIVMYNPLPGREDDFNRWLDEVHLPDLLALDEVVGATRMRLAMTQYHPGDEHKYISMYEIETDDIEAFHEKLMAGKKDRESTDAMDRSNHSARYFEVIGVQHPAP